VLTDAEALALAEDPSPDLAGLCADAMRAMASW
jgi:hypothetical protein